MTKEFKEGLPFGGCGGRDAHQKKRQKIGANRFKTSPPEKKIFVFLFSCVHL